VPAGAQAPAPQVLRGTDVVAGRTVTAWTAPMVTWLVERNKPKDCQAGQRGRMFFLPSSTGGNLRADCTVAAGTPVMILPAGIITIDETRFGIDPARQDDVVRVGVKIDGVPLRVRRSDWVRKHGFRLKGGGGATSGYYYAISGLAPGAHTIVLFDRVEPPGLVFRARTTISLTVQ
jgi:hypothetical protein